MLLSKRLTEQHQVPQDFVESFHHLYYGNIYGPGQLVIAYTSEEVASNVESFASAYRLGIGEKDPERWRNLPVGLAAEAVFAAEDGSAVVTTLYKPNSGDIRGSYYYHWVFLSRKRTTALGGAWDLVFEALAKSEPADLREVYPQPKQRTGHLQLRFAASQIEQSVRRHTERFFEEFKQPQDRLTAAQIVSLCLRGGEACVIKGIKTLPERLSAVLSTAALLPPPLRGFVSFATGVRHVEGCDVAIKFIDDDQAYGSSNYVVAWSAETKTFVGHLKPPDDLHPLVKRLLQAANDSPNALQQIHDKWSERSAALISHYDNPQHALQIFMRWIELDERCNDRCDLDTSADLATLLVDDRSVDNDQRQAFWRTIIAQAASSPYSPRIANIGKALFDHLSIWRDWFPNALSNMLLEEARGSSGLDVYRLAVRLLTEGYLPSSTWQSVLLDLALEHIRTRKAPGEVIAALLAFEQSQQHHKVNWPELLRTSTKVLSSVCVYLGEDDALKFFMLYLKHLPPPQIKELLDNSRGGWLKQLPRKLASALADWPELKPNIHQILKEYIPGPDRADHALLSILAALHPLKDVKWLMSHQTVSLLIRASKGSFATFATHEANAALHEMVMQGAWLEGVEASEVKLELLLWGLQRDEFSQKDLAWSTALSRLLETLLPNELMELSGFFKNLLGKGAPLSTLFTTLQKTTSPTTESYLRRQAALLRSSERSSWSQVPDLPRSLIQALATSPGFNLLQEIGDEKSIQLLEWQVNKDPMLTDPLTSKLLDWWIGYIEQTIRHRTYDWVNRTFDVLQSEESAAFRYCERKLIDILCNIELKDLLKDLENMRAKAVGQPQLRQTQRLLERAIFRKRLLPNNSIDEFIEEIRSAKALLQRLQALPLKDQSAEIMNLLDQELYNHRQQADELCKALEDFSELVYQVAKDYEATDRQTSGLLGLGRQIKPDLEEGKATPKSTLGLLRWLHGLTTRIKRITGTR